MWTISIKKFADEIQISEEETVKFRRTDLPQFEVHVHCYRILTQAEKAEVQEIVCKQLSQKRPVANVELPLEQGEFPQALKLLADRLSRLFAR
jgi:hypothetical protein